MENYKTTMQCLHSTQNQRFLNVFFRLIIYFFKVTTNICCLIVVLKPTTQCLQVTQN